MHTFIFTKNSPYLIAHVCSAAHITALLHATDETAEGQTFVQHSRLHHKNVLKKINKSLKFLRNIILAIDNFARFTWNIEKSSQFRTPPGAAIMDWRGPARWGCPNTALITFTIKTVVFDTY